MKKLVYLFAFVLLIGISACSEDNNSPVTTTTTVATTTSTTGVIAGVVSLPPASSGEVIRTRVALYNSIDDWAFDRTFKFIGCDVNGNYSLSNVTPGVYYMDAWRDNNNNRVWGDSGDFVAVWGSGAWPNYTLAPLQVAAGQTFPASFELYIVP